jgi:phosphoribosylglycinamide formyltransferase-1
MSLKNIAIFASGAGSNAGKIIKHFNKKSDSNARVVLIISNKPQAGVLKIAEDEKIPSIIITRDEFYSPSSCLTQLQSYSIDLVVLAGFLWKIPDALIEVYPRRIINIHPALLPAFGGKGMYGGFVHEAVIASGETESGITIHYVDEHYDNGDIIFQATCEVNANENPDELAKRIHALEHEHYPQVIEKIVSEL